MSAEQIQRNVPNGKFRVIGFTLRDGQTYLMGDFENIEAAEQSAAQRETLSTFITSLASF